MLKKDIAKKTTKPANETKNIFKLTPTDMKRIYGGIGGIIEDPNGGG